MDDLTELLQTLVATDSVNPSLVGGGAGEAATADAISDWSEAAGLEITLHEETAGRPSLVVRAKGTGGGRTLLLCGHIDTVTVEGMNDPHNPRIDGDRLYGRGAYDMKAGVAAALVACREAAGLKLRGDVVVAAVADEEHASLGIQEVLKHIKADAAVVTEPTEGQVVVAHKGFVWLEIVVDGRAAHGSRPHLGEDAIVKAGPILTALGELDERLNERQHPLLGRPSIHASTIQGGEELSSYPARCVIQVERRTLPGESGEQVEAELRELVKDRGTVRTLLVREPFEIDPHHDLVATVQRAANRSTVEGASYWADAAFIAAAGIPTVMFGPAGEGAHAAVEWVSLSSTHEVARVLVEVAKEICA